MERVKFEAGVAIDEQIIKEPDSMVESSSALRISRSELADAILTAFFNKEEKPVEKAGKLLITRRKRLI